METQTLTEHRRTLLPILCFFFAFLFIALMVSDQFFMNSFFGMQPINIPYISFFRPFQIKLPFIDGFVLRDFGIFLPLDHLILIPLFIALGLRYLNKEKGLKLIAFLASCVLSFKLLTTTAHVLRFLFDRRNADGMMM